MGRVIPLSYEPIYLTRVMNNAPLHPRAPQGE
jgi:hypothetical protein